MKIPLGAFDVIRRNILLGEKWKAGRPAEVIRVLEVVEGELSSWRSYPKSKYFKGMKKLA